MSRFIYYPNVNRVSTASDLSPTAVLAAIKQVDGYGSGLDADTVDGHAVPQQGTGSGQDPNTDIKIGWNATQQKVTLEAGSSGLGNVLTSNDLSKSLAITGRAYNPTEQLFDSTVISWDWSLTQAAELTITANRILDNPSNPANGQYASLRVNRTGAYILSFGSSFKGISSITQSSTTNAIDHFVFRFNGTYFELTSFVSNIGG